MAKESTAPTEKQEPADLVAKLLRDQIGELIVANCTGITEELKTAEDGKLSVSVGFKLALVGQRVYATTGISYSRKFKDEATGTIQLPDPKQPEFFERQ